MMVKWFRPGSFRSQLALRLVSAFAAVLLVVALAIHLALKAVLLSTLDRSLSSVASVQAGAIADSPPGDMRLHEWRLSPEKAAAIRHVNWFLQVWDQGGNSLLRSTYLEQDLPIEPRAFARARRGELVYATQAWPEGSLRILYYPIDRVDPRHRGHVLGIAASLSPMRETLRRVDVVLVVVALLGIGGAFAAGWRMAGEALKPVAQITEEAEGIEAGSLDRRITAHAGTVEFQRLVAVLNRMLDRIDAAFQSQKRFIADASHELRSPITALRGHLEVVRRRQRSTSEYEEAIDVALEEVHRLQALAEDLLTLARRDAGTLEPSLEPLRLDRLLFEVAGSYRALAEANGVTLEPHLDTPVPVLGDPDLLRRLVRNLLDNAIKYSPDGGRVSLRAGLSGDKAWLEVADTGPGVDPRHLPHLFDRFYRADPSRQRKTGTGLGLAIAQAIAEAHGGRLTARNRPSGGAVFRFEFAARAAVGATDAPAEGRAV
jgi:two-component system OmpR family sensor kinase